MNNTKKMSHMRANVAAAVAWASIISGCATENLDVKPAPPVPAAIALEPAAAPPAESVEKISERTARAAAQDALDGGVALYNSGDYRGAIKRFGAIYEGLKPYKEMELQALKLTAFSYCVTGRTMLCRQQFEKAVKLDPSFDLEPGEKGHPLWGPVFNRVKKKEIGS